MQAYPRYGSEKKGLPTTYYLTIADAPIRVHAELDKVDFVPLHDVSAFGLGDPLAGLVDGGDLFIQSPLPTAEAIWASIPAPARAELLARHIRVTALDTAALARRHAPRPELEIRMQGVALVGRVPPRRPLRRARRASTASALLEAVGTQLGRFFGKRGASVIAANLAVIAEAWDGLIDVTAAIAASAHAPRAWRLGVRMTAHEPSPARSSPTTWPRDPILIRADASLTDAAELMDRQHVHGLPVVDATGALIGVLSQTDLNRARSTEYLWVNWPGLRSGT